MGQQVKGYRRNARYGGPSNRRDGKGVGGHWEVNPPRQYGWRQSGSGLTSKEYGRGIGMGTEMRKRVEEAMQGAGYRTNGRVRRGNEHVGYVVRGEYRKSRRTEEKGKGVGRGRKEEGKGWIEKERRRTRSRRVRGMELEMGRRIGRERVNREYRVGGLGLLRECKIAWQLVKRRDRGYREQPKRENSKTTKKVRTHGVKRRRQARAVAVVRTGLMNMEGRRVKRFVRKRELAGRKQTQARRQREGRMRYHARSISTKYGRREAVETEGSKGGLVLGGYYGYKVTVIGPRDGARRTKKVVRGVGTVPQSRKVGRIGISEGIAKTSIGTRGVRVTYCYGVG